MRAFARGLQERKQKQDNPDEATYEIGDDGGMVGTPTEMLIYRVEKHLLGLSE